MDAGRGPRPALVGHRMSGFDDLDPAGRLTVAVFDDDEAAGDAFAERGFNRGGHAGGGFTGANDGDVVEICRVVALPTGQQGVAIGPQQALNRRGRVGGGDGGVDDPAETVASGRAD